MIFTAEMYEARSVGTSTAPAAVRTPATETFAAVSRPVIWPADAVTPEPNCAMFAVRSAVVIVVAETVAAVTVDAATFAVADSDPFSVTFFADIKPVTETAATVRPELI